MTKNTILNGKENVLTVKVGPATNTKRKPRSWEESYAALLQYREINGNANVPYPFPLDTALGSWVKNQRIYEHKLSQERRQQLIDIGFDFNRRPSGEEHWNKTFHELKQYKTATQDSLPHIGTELGRWAANQKRRIREGSAPETRQQMLASIGFLNQEDDNNNNNNKYDAIWKSNYDKLKVYHSKHGHCNIKTDQEDTAIYQWVCRQRYLNHKGLISADRKELLDKLGFNWLTKGTKLSRQQEWEENFEKLVLFQKENPTKKLRNAPKNLSGWLTIQKTRFRNGDMDPERAKKLVGIGFQPPMESERSWNGRYQQLKVVASWEDLQKDLCLKRWVQLQQFLHQKGLLANDKVNRLDAIGFQWDHQAKRRSALMTSTKKADPIGNNLRASAVEPTPRKRRGSAEEQQLMTATKRRLSLTGRKESIGDPTPRKRRSSAEEQAILPKRRLSLAGSMMENENFTTPMKRRAFAIPDSMKASTKKRRSSLMTVGQLQF